VQAVLPPDDALRAVLHDKCTRVAGAHPVPALVHVAVLNAGIGRDDECAPAPARPAGPHARRSGRQLPAAAAGRAILKWEAYRVHPLRTDPAVARRRRLTPGRTPGWAPADNGQRRLALLDSDGAWLRAIPGRTIAAVKLAMVHGRLDAPAGLVELAQRWLGSAAVAASLTCRSERGDCHSLVVTDFALRADGVEHMLVVAPASTTEMRAGRIAQRLLDLETYRLMALRGVPAAKALAPELDDAEATLTALSAQLESVQGSDQLLLERLIALAARLERATTAHDYRFAATRAYDTLVAQRVAELREAAIPGVQMLGVFLQRRMNPAIATVAAGERRLASLSQRVERTSALLRTRVDIATEARSQQLLAKLTRGQELQLRLQTTVEGLSIAAISYYVVSLLLYGAKAAKAAGLPINPEIATGALIPLVLWGVWRTTRRIHARLHAGAHG
jgi:uncharacterized membrane-anchored protein